MGEPRAAIGLDRVSKRFGGVGAVDGVSLEIGEGEFFSLLGPSGCGKTTTLRMVAGFERPDEGRIVLQGDDVTDVPANRRPLNMVFFTGLALYLTHKRAPAIAETKPVSSVVDFGAAVGR
jgi:ABC-type Fe3+/spermidine/putrescine transport system ATPase subunit